MEVIEPTQVSKITYFRENTLLLQFGLYALITTL
jgi:hypothetical protein